QSQLRLFFVAIGWVEAAIECQLSLQMIAILFLNSSLMSGTIITLHNCPASQFVGCINYAVTPAGCSAFHAREPCSRDSLRMRMRRGRLSGTRRISKMGNLRVELSAQYPI
ncbi:MAG: hypothetical protein VXY82_04850, partial [Planctomycetota bacterium]|nr:hypothetical protein [Planctomycetota bacterium]